MGHLILWSYQILVFGDLCDGSGKCSQSRVELAIGGVSSETDEEEEAA